jgi:hypothetical protein
MSNFIHQQFLEDVSICDKIVDFYKNNPYKGLGCTTKGINTDWKDSTDCEFLGDLLADYVVQLQAVVNRYIEIYPSCNMYAPWSIASQVNIQGYAPNGGYKVWHTERPTMTYPAAARHLTFMTYLNDVTDQGGTEFMNQKLTVDAEKGKTVIWPCDWTHTHRGVVSPTQEKIIVTGWFSFTA